MHIWLLLISCPLPLLCPLTGTLLPNSSFPRCIIPPPTMYSFSVRLFMTFYSKCTPQIGSAVSRTKRCIRWQLGWVSLCWCPSPNRDEFTNHWHFMLWGSRFTHAVSGNGHLNVFWQDGWFRGTSILAWHSGQISLIKSRKTRFSDVEAASQGIEVHPSYPEHFSELLTVTPPSPCDWTWSTVDCRRKGRKLLNIPGVSIDLDVSCDGKAYPDGHWVLPPLPGCWLPSVHPGSEPSTCPSVPHSPLIRDPLQYISSTKCLLFL